MRGRLGPTLQWPKFFGVRKMIGGIAAQKLDSIHVLKFEVKIDCSAPQLHHANLTRENREKDGRCSAAPRGPRTPDPPPPPPSTRPSPSPSAFTRGLVFPVGRGAQSASAFHPPWALYAGEGSQPAFFCGQDVNVYTKHFPHRENFPPLSHPHLRPLGSRAF